MNSVSIQRKICGKIETNPVNLRIDMISNISLSNLHSEPKYR